MKSQLKKISTNKAGHGTMTKCNVWDTFENLIFRLAYQKWILSSFIKNFKTAGGLFGLTYVVSKIYVSYI